MQTINRWAAIIGITLGVTGTAILGFDELTSNVTEAHASVAGDIHLTIGDTEIQFVEAYLENTKVGDLGDDCKDGTLPEAVEDDADKTISKPVVRLRVDGVQMCIVEGGTVEIEDGDVALRVLEVSADQVGNEHFTKLAAYEPPNPLKFLLQVLSGVVLGIGTGALIPAVIDWNNSRKATSSPPQAPTPTAP